MISVKVSFSTLMVMDLPLLEGLYKKFSSGP